MPHATPLRNLPYPDIDDGPADVPLWVGNLAVALDNYMPFSQGPLSARPVSTPANPGAQGRWYWANDTPNVIYYDYGTGWVTIGAPPANAVITNPAGGGNQTIAGQLTALQFTSTSGEFDVGSDVRIIAQGARTINVAPVMAGEDPVALAINGVILPHPFLTMGA
jgi:hypothetical protein